ncbi:MAG: aldehyde dehydrogenase family protein [Methanomassiliicoccaceae archaeon]|jgi:acyl-CoA reductase-like NAD-dependent aldehyde dehydrogenase|nr:aldehyde dehydrogenase family protein [Methanomassiliicoccaceae archaeon]
MTDGDTYKDASSNADTDKRFDGAFNSILHVDKKDYPCYVGGLKVASGNEYIVKSPLDETIQFGRFQEPETDLPDRAADVAANAFASWSKTDNTKRASIFENALETIKKQRFRIAAAVTLSSGMTRDDSIYEAERLIEVIEEGIEKIMEGVKGRPIGVWAVISEYNSPLAAPMSYAVSAMLAGNTVIMIPPKECPFPSYLLYDIFVSAGLPDGVFNLIFDRRGKATGTLMENENIKGIVATGRGDRFEDMMFAAVDDSVKVISEFKGMNPLLIYRPQSMQAAADAAIMSAFGYSGQRVDSCSKVIITAGEQRTFIDHLLLAAKKMVIGDPAEKETFAGPVISRESMEMFLELVKGSKDNLVFGGKQMINEVTEAGHYVMPAIFVGLPEDHVLNTMDNSLPILSVQTVNDIDEAIEMANSCEFGSSMGIISKDERIIERFLGEASSDVVYVNGTSDTVGVAIRADVTEFLKK